MTPIKKLLSACALVALLAAGACTKNNDDANDTNNTQTSEPTSSPGPEAVGDFQVVGNVDHAFVGAAPSTDVSNVDTSSSFPDTSPDASTEPSPTPAGATPASGGVLRLSIEDLSGDLKDACGVDTGSKIDVYWTVDTAFSPASIVATTLGIEDRLEGETAGVSGTIVRANGEDNGAIGGATPDVTTSASSTPSSSDAVGGADCVLVAQQIGLTSSGTLPTSRPRRTATPTHAPTATPTSTKTPKPTSTATSAPTASPSTAPSPTGP